MSYDVTKLTKLGSLKELAQRINTDFAKKTELTPIKNSADAAFRICSVSRLSFLLNAKIINKHPDIISNFVHSL